MDKVTIEWANDEKTVVLCTYLQDGWTWEDSFKALDAQRALIETSDAPIVDVIIDTRKTNWMPRGGSIISGIRKINSSRHPRQGQTIVVGARGILATMANVMIKMIDSRRREFQFVRTMEEAYSVIANLNAERQRETTS